MGGKQSPEAESDRDGESKKANQAGQGTQEEAKKIWGRDLVVRAGFKPILTCFSFRALRLCARQT